MGSSKNVHSATSLSHLLMVNEALLTTKNSLAVYVSTSSFSPRHPIILISIRKDQQIKAGSNTRDNFDAAPIDTYAEVHTCTILIR